MSIDTVAVLPPVVVREGSAVDGEWHEGEGPGGARGVFRPLRDGLLVNLGLSIEAPDADLFDAARQWTGKLSTRVWVFPDTAVPEDDTVKAVRAATREVGRWVKAGPKPWQFFEDLGLTRDEAEAFQREMNSGDPKRAAAAVSTFERMMEGKDPAKIEFLLAALFRRG